jgi:hypothetical protein
MIEHLIIYLVAEPLRKWWERRSPLNVLIPEYERLLREPDALLAEKKFRSDQHQEPSSGS